MTAARITPGGADAVRVRAETAAGGGRPIRAYYNEHDPYAAQWLRNLIAAGHITPGDVDERSIVNVRPADVAGYDRCHFFAGIAGWDRALDLAGWGVRPVWTGSCPCPPFSAAGKGQRCPSCGSPRNLCHPRKTGHFVCLDCGCDRHADDRHLWPEFSRLIEGGRPSAVFGEQVASSDGRLWLATVRADLARLGYSVGAADLCAAGVGAPHIRQRLWFVADADGGHAVAERQQPGWQYRQQQAHRSAGREPMADDLGSRLEGCNARSLGDGRATAERGGAAGDLAYTSGAGWGPKPTDLNAANRSEALRRGASQSGRRRSVDPWSDLDWLPCRDGKARPTQPGLQPLAHGATARVGKLRAAGNAIVPDAAAAFVSAYLDTLEVA